MQVRAQLQPLDGRQRGQAGQQGRQPPGVQVASRPSASPLLADDQSIDALDRAAPRQEPPPGARFFGRACGSHGALVARTPKGPATAPHRCSCKHVNRRYQQTRACQDHHTLSGATAQSSKVRTRPSKRLPHPGEHEVHLQRAPERLLERLLEAPVTRIGSQAQLLQACDCFLCFKVRCAPADCLQGKCLCQASRGTTRSASQNRPLTPAAPAEAKQHPLEARRGPCVHSAAAPAATGRAQAPLHAPLRGVGPGVWLKAWLRQPWNHACPLLRCVIRCCRTTHDAGDKHAACGCKDSEQRCTRMRKPQPVQLRLLRQPVPTPTAQSPNKGVHSHVLTSFRFHQLSIQHKNEPCLVMHPRVVAPFSGLHSLAVQAGPRQAALTKVRD